MISLRSFCYFIVLMALFNIPPVFSSFKCRGEFDFKERQEKLLAKFSYYERSGSATFRELITKHKREGKHYLFLLSISPVQDRANIIKNMNTDEVRLLPEPVKEALVHISKSFGHVSSPLFFVNHTRDLKKVSHLLSYMEDRYIHVFPISLRRKIIENLEPEDKRRLSNNQLKKLKRGTIYESMGS